MFILLVILDMDAQDVVNPYLTSYTPLSPPKRLIIYHCSCVIFDISDSIILQFLIVYDSSHMLPLNASTEVDEIHLKAIEKANVKEVFNMFYESTGNIEQLHSLHHKKLLKKQLRLDDWSL